MSRAEGAPDPHPLFDTAWYKVRASSRLMPGRTALETFLAADDDIFLSPFFSDFPSLLRDETGARLGYLELFKSGFVYRSPPPAPACGVKSAPQRNGRRLWQSVAVSR